MSNITQRDYDRQVEATALNILDKIEDYPEDYGDDEHQAVFEEVDSHQYVTWNSYYLDVLRFSRNGPEEWRNYVEDGEDNHWSILQAMAYTAFRADVYEEMRRIREAREELGECTNLIGERYIYDEGVTFEFEYDSGYRDDETVTYTLKSATRLGDEWAVIDPDGRQFEMISPTVMIEHGSSESEAKNFLNNLKNICARREHERDEINDE